MAMNELSQKILQLPLFVYGTLRPGEHNYSLYLEGRTEREFAATLRATLYYVAAGGYPYVTSGTDLVRGELIYIAARDYAETLAAIDELEEYDAACALRSIYVRRRAWVQLSDSTQAEAWAYFWNGPELLGERIAEGDFRRRKP